MKLIRLLPLNTFSSKYFSYVLNNNSYLSYNYYLNNELKESKLNNSDKKDIKDIDKFRYNKLELIEKINNISKYNSDNIINLSISLKIPEVSHDNIICEKIYIENSIYQYKINYKLILNNQIINSFSIYKDDYNSKNFDKNFKYYLEKYDYMKHIEYLM